jgi:hypothetical protein
MLDMQPHEILIILVAVIVMLVTMGQLLKVKKQ